MDVVALDSNRYTDLAGGDSDAVSIVRAAKRIAMPLIVVGELRAGFLGGKRQRENGLKLDRFLSAPNVVVLLPDDGTSHRYASAVQHLRAIGRPMQSNDIWIAALCLQHSVPLFTRDTGFRNVAGLSLV